MSKSTILLSTVSPSSNLHTSYLQNLQREIAALSITGKPDVLPAIKSTYIELLGELQEHWDDTTIFHFEGRAEDYQALLTACSGTEPLPTLLATMPKLRLVFLNYCSRKKFIDELEAAGIRVIIGTSHRLRYNQVRQFSSTFYQYFLSDTVSVEEAYDQAIAVAHISHRNAIPGQSKPFYVHLRGDRNLQRSWIMPPPHIIGTTEPSTPDKAASNKTELVEEELPPLPTNLELPSEPFPGLTAYQQKDAQVFFGRETECRELYRSVVSSTVPNIILFHGQAGIGKTSLLMASLLPRLEAKQHAVIALQGRKPELLFTELCTALDESPNSAPHATNFGDAFFKRSTVGVTIVVDQAEALVGTEAQRPVSVQAHFWDALRILLARGPDSSQRKVVFCLRTESLEAIQQLLSEQRLRSFSIAEPLLPLDHHAICEIIRKFTQPPALQIHYEFVIEPGLNEEIANDLCTDKASSIAPFLQATLMKLWQNAQQSGMNPKYLTRTAYRLLSEQDEIFADFLMKQLGELRRQWPSLLNGKLPITILALHTLLIDAKTLKALVALEKAYPQQDVEQMVIKLKDCYLLTATLQNNLIQPQIGHQLLNEPIAKHLEPRSRPAKWPLTIPTTRVEGLLQGPQAFVENCLDGVSTRVDAWGAKIKRPFTALPHRFYVPALLLLLIVSIIILHRVVFAIQQGSDLKPYIGDLRQPSLFQIAPQQGGNSFWESLIEGFTGFHALKAGRDFAFAGVTLLPLHSYPPTQFHHQMRGNLVLGLDGKRLLYGGDDGVLYAYPITGEKETTLPIENSTTIHAVAASPDGHSFLIAREDGVTNFFRYDTTYHFEFSEKLPKHKGPVTAVSFNQDGTLMITGGVDGEIRLYNTATRTRLYLKVNHQDAVSAVAIHPMNDVLAYASVADNKIYLIDWKTGRTINNLAAHTASINSLEFSQDGDHLLSSSSDGTVRVWKVKEGIEEHRFGEATNILNIARYGLNSQFIYTANVGGALQVWDAKTYMLLDTIKEDMNSIIALALSNDGKLVVTVDRNDKLRLWGVVTLNNFTP